MDTSEEKSTYLSPKPMIKRRRRPSVLSTKKYFRKSIKHDLVEYTIPNNSLSIIEISSTDSESFKTSVSNDEIDESYIPDPKTQNSKNSSGSEEIISPSPNKNNKHLKCLSTGKKRAININVNRNKFNQQDLKNKRGEDIMNNKKKSCENPGIFLELSVLDYDKFRKSTTALNSLMNSTMIQPEETKQIILEPDVQDNMNASVESMDKSCENLLDDIYGDSWRPYREKILPTSERKPPTKKMLVGKQISATERKVKKSEIYKNPYVENEKYKSNNLLKALHTKRIREAIESPMIQRVKGLCDEDSTEQSEVASSPQYQIPRMKLTFDETKKSLEDEESEDLKYLTKPILNGDRDLCWSDKENSLDNLPLKDRIIQKKLMNEKNENNLEKEEYGSKSKKESESDNNIDDIVPSKSGFSSESNNEDIKKRSPSLNMKEQINQKNCKNYPETSSSSDESSSDSDGNIGIDIKKRAVNKRLLRKYFDSSDSSNDKKIVAPEEIPSLSNNLKNRIKKVTKKLPKTNIAQNSKEESNEIPYIEKPDGKNIKKKVSKKKTKKRTNSLDDSSDNPVEYKSKLDLKKKTNEIRTYSFLASLSSNIPDHQCDPTAKIFKANFKNNKETLAKKLFQLYNENVFDNLLPKSVPLEWNARMLCTAGYCNSKRVTHRDGKVDMEANIVLSTKVLTTPDRLRDTLIHEMCHAATWLIDKVRDGHGKYWKAWASKAKKAYPELPPIKTCHNYELSSKYVYKCTGCGYEVKRHRKSLDIERKRCGYCYGKFQIFINKVNKKGEQKMVPIVDTPKKEPKGFAAFYQENYANYKTPRNTPAEVMKLLSDKFKEMKVV